MANIIDELIVTLGLDASKINEDISKVGEVLGEINNAVKDFGEGVSEGFSGAEEGAGQVSAALDGVKTDAQQAGQELEKVGAVGAVATAKVESGAKKAGKQVGFIGRQANAAGKRLARISKAAITGFAAGLAAPLLGALALNTVVKDYTEGLKRLEELNKKRNLSLKERQERQDLLNKYTEKDIKLYRETSKIFGSLGDTLGGLGRDIMRALLPAFAALARGLMAVIEWVKENKQHWQVLIPLLAVGAVMALKALAAILISTVIPAVIAFTVALLTNPVTWIIIALIALGVLLEDLIVWCRGGEAAFGGLWGTLAKGVNKIKELYEKFKKFLTDLANSNKIVGNVFKYLESILKGIVALFTGDIDEALEHFESAGQAAADLVKDAFEGLLGIFKDIYDWVANKIAGAIDKVKEKAQGIANAIKIPGAKLDDLAFDMTGNLGGWIPPAMVDADFQARMAAEGAGGPTSVDNSTTTTVTGTTINVDARGQTNEQVGAVTAEALKGKLVNSNNRSGKSGS